MSPMIERGDWLVVHKVADADRDSIRRSDIVLFRHPFGSSLRAVKRAVAVGGDSVEIARGFVRVNGRAIPVSGDHALYGTKPVPRSERVPPGHVFVLGDNAPGSVDSRSFGPVPEPEIVGRVWFVFAIPAWWPLAALAALALAVCAFLLVAWKRRSVTAVTDCGRATA